MKLLNLQLLNLASLDNPDGEEIDFQHGPIGETSIFSIVGPTGSGKSTILDAICLALYNRAPRYPYVPRAKNRAIKIYGNSDDSENGRLAPDDTRNILTRGKKFGYSKLTFRANNGNIYRAEWSVRHATVRYQNVERHLYLISNTPDGLHEAEVDHNLLEDIIGLDYDQFLRTVLIAQGSFANFLNAKEDERYLLLERIIGCKETYLDIASNIKEQRDLCEAHYNKLSSGFENLSHARLDKQRLDQLNGVIADLEKAKHDNEVTLQAVSADIEWYNRQLKLLSDIDNLRAKLLQARNDLDNMRDMCDFITLHDALAPALSMLQSYDRNKAEYDTDVKYITVTNQAIAEIVEAVNNESETIRRLTNLALQARLNLENAKPGILKAREIRTRISTESERIDQLNKAADDAKAALKLANKELSENKTDIELNRDNKDKAQLRLKETADNLQSQKELFLNQEEQLDSQIDDIKSNLDLLDINNIVSRKELAAAMLVDLNLAIDSLQEIDKCIRLRNDTDAQLLKLTDENRSLAEQLSKLDITNQRNRVETLTRTVTLFNSEKWSLHRNALSAGSPCPLCGSIDHPYADDDKRLEAAEQLDSMLKEQKSLLDEMMMHEKKLTADINKNDGLLKGLQRDIDSANEKIKALQTTLDEVCSRHDSFSGRSIADLKQILPDIIEQKEKAAQDFKHCQNLRQQLDSLLTQKANLIKNRDKKIEQLSQTHQKAQEAYNAAEGKYNLALSATTDILKRISDREQAAISADNALAEAEKKCDDLKADFDKLLDGADPDSVETDLTKKQSEAEKEVDRHKETFTKQSEALGTLRGALDMRSKIRDEHRKNADTDLENLNLWIDNYNQNHTAISIDTIRSVLDNPIDIEGIRNKRDTIQKALTSAETLYNQAVDANNTHQLSKPQLSVDVLTQKKESLAKTDRDIIAKLIEANATLQNHFEAEKQLGDIAQQLDRSLQDKNDWQEIYDAIGTDGKTLRKIAQCYTLHFLIDRANSEIRKFNSRYQLMHVKNSLGIRIIDHDRADDIRDTTSLSGGETFIVSLGLALGLSTLSSRNISFENIFIDEGFGTLDPETLATVIDSLAMLHSSQGKKVGVISHTDTMSERITTQIRVIKNGNTGSSRIQISDN